MTSNYQNFKALHESDELFLLPNAWNAESAAIFQDNGFSAIGTSSAAVAGSLGYEDGEKMPFEDYLFIIKRIASVIQVPLTVDLEMGYGTTHDEITTNILQIAELGVAGINLEDSRISKSKRYLQDAITFAKKLEHIRNKLTAMDVNVFINVRCDTYLLNVDNKQEETLHRAKLYQVAGADGLFLPCIWQEEDIRAARSFTCLPLNVMSFPGLPDFEVLNHLGVKRVSMGGFMFDTVYNNLKIKSAEFMTGSNVAMLFSSEVPVR